MKKLLLFTIFLILIATTYKVYAHYNMTTPVEGGSIANNELQFLVIQQAYTMLAPKTPTCTDYFVNNTQILHYPYDVKKDKNGKYVKGYWKELWSINACGKVKQLPITFYIRKKNTIFDIDTSAIQ